MGCAITKKILWVLTIGNSVYVHPVIWQKIENQWFTQNRSNSTWGCKSPSLIVPLWKIFSVFSSSLFPLTFKPIYVQLLWVHKQKAAWDFCTTGPYLVEAKQWTSQGSLPMIGTCSRLSNLWCHPPDPEQKANFKFLNNYEFWIFTSSFRASNIVVLWWYKLNLSSILVVTKVMIKVNA